MHMRTPEREHVLPVTTPIMKKPTSDTSWWGCGEKETGTHFWVECKLVSPLWNRIWRFRRRTENRTIMWAFPGGSVGSGSGIVTAVACIWSHAGTPRSVAFFFFFQFFFLGPHPWHMDSPRLGVLLELQLPACTTATATPDQNCVCDLHHSSGQRGIPDPLSEARGQTLILMDAS